MKLIKKTTVAIWGISLSLTVFASTYPLPTTENSIIGKPQLVRVGFRNYVQLTQDYDIGYFELVEANPGVDINRLHASTTLLIPSEHILPMTPREGVVINLAEMRMYFYPTDSNQVLTFPVGIGKQGDWSTPIGATKVISKAADPSWRPTPAVRADFLKQYGYPLPEVVQPGPDNPLGPYAIRLGWGSYLIHGSNDPDGMGRRVSAGCIRMFNPDIAQVYQGVVPGETPVRMVYERFKAGWQGNTLYLEAHMPIEGHKGVGYKQVINTAVKDRTGKVTVNWAQAKNVAKLALGIPQPIGKVTGGDALPAAVLPDPASANTQ